MPRIHTITTDTVITDNDMILGTDGAVGANKATKNFSFGVFKNYLWTNVTFTGDLNVSGGNIILDNNKFLTSKMANGSAASLIGIASNNQIKIASDNQPVYTGTGLTNLGGDLEVNGNVSISGNYVGPNFLNGNWNAAYNYSQVGHLPLAGGTLTGTVNTAAVNVLAELLVGTGGDGHVFKLFGDTVGRGVNFDPTGNATLTFLDNTMAKFGTDGDLHIYHNGTSNYIDSNGGQMYLRASVSDGKMFFMGDDGNGGYAEYFYLDGAAAVYDSNQGQHVSVETRFPVDSKATFGITGSMQTSLWSSNAGNFFMSETGGGNMYFQTDGTEIVFSKRGSGATHQAPLTGAETMAKFIIDGAIELYHNNVKKFETTANGIQTSGTVNVNGAFSLPTADGTSGQVLITDGSGAVTWGTNTSGTLEDILALGNQTGSTNKISVQSGIDFIDNAKIRMGHSGTGNDLQLFHDGTDSYVSDTGTGNLYIKGGDQVRIVGDTANSDEIWAVFGADAAELWFNGNKKLETTNTGIKVTGAAEIGNFKIPAVMGSAGQVLKVPSSGSLLEFADDDGALLGIQQGGEFTNSLIVGHAGTGTLNAAQGNTGLGVGAMNAITSGDNNVALGHDALGTVTTGSNNTGVGKQALFTLVGSHSNVAVGKDALYNANTQDASSYPDNGSKNVAIGFNAGSGITYGKENVFIGWEAGKTFTTGLKNICIGHGADATSTNGAKFNSIAIGHDVKITSSNTIVIGSTNYDRTTVHALHDHAGLISSGTTTLTRTDSGKTYEAAGNPGSGYTVNLPDAGSSTEAGWHVEVQISVNPTNNLKVVANDTSTDKLIGYVQCINASTGATSIFRAQDSDNYSAITFNGTSQGTVGSNVKIKKGVFSDKFNISGTLICTTTPANPFTTT